MANKWNWIHGFVERETGVVDPLLELSGRERREEESPFLCLLKTKNIFLPPQVRCLEAFLGYLWNARMCIRILIVMHIYFEKDVHLGIIFVF